MTILGRAIALLSILPAAVLAGCAPTATPEGTGGYVDKGAVLLTGFVVTEASARAAVRMAQDVKGVSSVKDDMRNM